jgi:hypothetical protein
MPYKSVYFARLKTTLLFINDPSARVIHIVNRNKYLQSYPLLAHALCYAKENHRLTLASNRDICSIDFNTHERFFMKFT